MEHRRLLAAAVFFGVVVGTIYFNMFYWNSETGMVQVYYSFPEIIRQIHIGKELLLYVFLFRMKQCIVLVLLYCLLPGKIFTGVFGVAAGFAFGIVCCVQIISLPIF